MVNQTFISQLKQINISNDIEKTKDRIAEYWKDADSKKKKTIIALASSNSSSIYRVARLGNVSAKIVVAFAIICNVNPYYFTGQADEPSECNDTLIKSFLIDLGYEDLLAKEMKKQSKSLKKQSSLDVEAINNEDIDKLDEENEDKEEIDFNRAGHKDGNNVVMSIINQFVKGQMDLTDAQINAIQTISDSDIEYLLKALSIKSKVGGPASVVYKLIKLILIS